MQKLIYIFLSKYKSNAHYDITFSETVDKLWYIYDNINNLVNRQKQTSHRCFLFF